MTRQEAAEKVAKLVSLARGNANPHEAAAARAQAKRIVDEHKLTLEEMSAGKKAHAFDDLVVAVRKTIADSPDMPPGLFGTASAVSGILNHLEKMSEESKSRRLDEVGKLIETASVLNKALSNVGLSSPIVTQIKATFDATLAAHDLTH